MIEEQNQYADYQDAENYKTPESEERSYGLDAILKALVFGILIAYGLFLAEKRILDYLYGAKSVYIFDRLNIVMYICYAVGFYFGFKVALKLVGESQETRLIRKSIFSIIIMIFCFYYYLMSVSYLNDSGIYKERPFDNQLSCSWDEIEKISIYKNSRDTFHYVAIYKKAIRDQQKFIDLNFDVDANDFRINYFLYQYLKEIKKLDVTVAENAKDELEIITKIYSTNQHNDNTN